MKIITVDKPVAEDRSWIVHSARTKLGQSFKDWIKDIEKEIKDRNEKGDNIEGIYLYDIMVMYQEIEEGNFQITQYPRYCFFRNKN